jgi:hypothetical protein
MNKAVFIDKDGTLIKDIPYNVNTSLIVIEDQVVEALRTLQACGYRLILISNQPGVAFGYFTENAVQQGFPFPEKQDETAGRTTGWILLLSAPPRWHTRALCYHLPLPQAVARHVTESSCRT